MRTGCPEGRRSVNVLDDRHVRKSSICHSWCTCNVLAFLFFSARSRACSMGLHENGVRGPGAGPTGSCSAVRTGTGTACRGGARGGQQGSEVRASSLCAPLGAQARVGSLESPPKKKKRRHEAPCGKKKACALKREALQNANSRSRGREGGDGSTVTRLNCQEHLRACFRWRLVYVQRCPGQRPFCHMYVQG